MSLLFKLGCAAVICGSASTVATAQTVDPFYACAYTFTDLGTPPDVPGSLGGLVFKADDPDTLLIGGSANSSSGTLYAVPVIRDADDHVIGFGEASTVFAPAPNIDGGLFYGPGGVLFYSRYSNNNIGQILPGETETARDDNLTALGFTSSLGAMMVVPDGFQGAGRLKVASFNASVWHDAELSPDGNGTYDISAPTNAITIGGGPEGIVYVEAGATLFPVESVLVSGYSSGQIVTYETDANGDPIIDTERVFITGLSGAEGGTRDPLTGDFLFSTFGGGDRVLVVRGFTPECDVPANLNRDCLLDFFDVQMFLIAFAAQDPIGDFNNDDMFDFFDALAFLAGFAAGCE